MSFGFHARIVAIEAEAEAEAHGHGDEPGHGVAVIAFHAQERAGVVRVALRHLSGQNASGTRRALNQITTAAGERSFIAPGRAAEFLRHLWSASVACEMMPSQNK